MSNKEEIRICIRTPKLGTLIFFLVFMIGVPAVLVGFDQKELLKYYLPFVVMLASTLTTAGHPDQMQDLYPLRPVNVIGFLSRNLIDLVALIGIIWTSIDVAVHNPIESAVIVGTIMAIITFPVSTQAIPFFIRQGDKFLYQHTNLNYPGNWHRYFLGFFMMICLIGIQLLLVDLLTDDL